MGGLGDAGHSGSPDRAGMGGLRCGRRAVDSDRVRRADFDAVGKQQSDQRGG